MVRVLTAAGGAPGKIAVEAPTIPSSLSHTFNLRSRNKSPAHRVLASCKGLSPLLQESGSRRKLNPV
jgi:hypothetical protein